MNKKISIILGIALIGLLTMAIFISPKEDVFEENLLGIDYKVDGNEASITYGTDHPVVAMYIKKYGSIVIELYPEIAPNTVSNFISLVKKGFYDQNTFHRLMRGFVLQGGDPTGTGNGGPEYFIKGEFNNNGFDNSLSHKKWIVSMARSSQSNDTAGSQFFICLEDATHLDGNYAAFGKVIAGFEAIEEIASREIIKDLENGLLETNLVLEKALVDLKSYGYSEPEIIAK